MVKDYQKVYTRLKSVFTNRNSVVLLRLSGMIPPPRIRCYTRELPRMEAYSQVFITAFFQLTCCGSVSFNSWSDSEWQNLEKLARFDGEVVPSLPPSCCVVYPNSTTDNQQYINIQACQGITQSIPNEFMHQTVSITSNGNVCYG